MHDLRCFLLISALTILATVGCDAADPDLGLWIRFLHGWDGHFEQARVVPGRAEGLHLVFRDDTVGLRHLGAKRPVQKENR